MSQSNNTTNYASPIIANLPRGWINFEGSIPNRTPLHSYGMYENYDHSELPAFPQDTNYNESLVKCGAISTTTPNNNLTQLVDPNIPNVLKQLFSDQSFFGSKNGVCHYWLRDVIGPLDVYLPNNQFVLYPFYHDQQSCMTWFALCDLTVTDPTKIGSTAKPCVVSGLSGEDIEADEDFFPNVLRLTSFVLVADTIEEFVWREGIEAEISNPNGNLSTEAQNYLQGYQ